MVSQVKRTLLAFSAAVGVASPVGAQQPDTTRGHPLPALSVDAIRASSIAPPVATRSVDSLVLKKAQASNVWDLVRRVAGVEIHEQGQGPGFASDAVIRGFTSDHSSDVLLVIDGVPVNLPLHGHVEGYADWNILFPAAAAQLRVIHGPASPLYGDFAYGGVVEVTTAATGSGVGGALSGSSYGDASAWLRTGSESDRGGWLLSGRFGRNEGWRNHDSNVLGNGLLRGRRSFGNGGRLEGGVLFYGSDWDSPGFVSLDDFAADRVRTAADTTDGGHGWRSIAHLRYTQLLTPHLGLAALGWAQGGRGTRFLNIPEAGEELHQSEENDRRAALGGQLQLTWHTRAGEFSLGGAGRWDDVGYRLWTTRARVRQDGEDEFDGRFRSGSLFGRWRKLFGPVQLDLGARGDVLHYERDDLLAGGVHAAHSFSVFSPKLGARYLAGSHVALLASLSRGFRGSPGVIEEPTREPQRSWAKELGIELYPGSAELRLSLFRIDVQHEVIQDPVTREILNAGASRRQGIDADVAVPIGERLLLTGSATFNDANLKAESDVTASITARRESEVSGRAPLFHLAPLSPGDPVPGVSRYLGRVGLDVRATARLTLGGLARWNGPFTPIGEPGVRTDGYLLADLSASWTLTPRWSVDAELQNLFNAKYPEVRASGFLNPGAPRVLRAELRLR